jgi:alpha-L-rhamnosidase
MKMPCRAFLILVFLVITAAHAGTGQTPKSVLSPTFLRCEYLNDPVGIDATQPRLMWELEGKGRNQRQTAYHILVATSPRLLNETDADLWNSQKVTSDETAHVRYAGKELKSAQQIFWQVRVWDGDGQPSDWSAPAKWSMGLLHDEDWRAKWIGLEGSTVTNVLRGADWICFPADNAEPPTSVAKRFYRREFVIPTDREIKRAVFLNTGDREVTEWVNGPAARLEPGETNVVALTSVVPGDTVKSGGVVGLLKIECMAGEPLLIPTDERWKVATNEIPHWNEPGFDDSQWPAAKSLGPAGSQPWGEVRIAEDRRLPARWLRKEFTVRKKIRRATVYYSGLGWSELYLNGVKVGDHVLSPGLTEYPRRVFYVAFDVTRQVRAGKNALGAVLGNGRYYSPRSSVYASMPSHGFPKLRLHLRLEHNDGTISEVVSDESWKLTADGPIVANNDYDGEEYDARKELGDWAGVGYDDAKWQHAETVPAPAGKLVAQMMEPIRVTRTFKPVTVSEPKPGVLVFDLGQNIVGWCRLKVSGAAGTTVTLRHSETLKPNGTLHLPNLRSAQATDVYILKGEGLELWQPRFTTHGFRYVEVRGFPGKLYVQSLEACVVNDDLRATGEFTSSNPLLNQIYRNAVWGVRGNYKSIPMDCPQRDERQGWLGDRSEGSRGEAYLFDNAALYAKWLQDIRDVQWDNGSLPDVAPGFWPTRTDNVVWPSSAIIIPNFIHEHFADAEVPARNYETGKRWMDFMGRHVNNGIITRDNYGDWCVPPEDPRLIHSNDPKRQTGKALLATTYFYHDARLMENFARHLGRTGDEAQFAALAETLKTAFNKYYFNRKLGQYDNGTQTSFILPLAFGLVPEDERERVFGNLVRNITEVTHSHVGTGLVGGQYLYRVLTDNGRADLAYTLATQTNYPGYGYMISQGATTIWELWNGDTATFSMNSGNHVMLLGDFLIWLYEDLAGIAADPAQPGFKHIVMKPHPVDDLKFVRASYHSVRGLIASEWHQSPDTFDWRITIPPNTTATIFIPATNAERVTESGKPAREAEGVEFIRREKDRAVFRIRSGEYHFAVAQ